MVFDYNLVLGPSIIEIVPSTKTLGVIFQENLSWDFYIEGLIREISKAFGILNRFRFDHPIKIKLLLYNSLFSSHLNYCHLVWGTTTLTNINNLHVSQKKAIRSIVNAPYDSHTQPFFKTLHITPVTNLYDNTMSLRYTAGIKLKNSLFQEIAGLARSINFYSTRNEDVCKVPYSRTNYGTQMLRHHLPSLLNNLRSNNFTTETLTPRAIKNMFL